ncbi:MAG: SCO family protein, partial [Bryobacteraceae bacterium]
MMLTLAPLSNRLAPAQGGETARHSARAPALESYRGGVVTPPLPKPELKLRDTAGARFELSPATRGRVTLLFFGYTHC